MRTLRVLIVDDSEIVRAVVSALLEERGHQVVALDDPAQLATELSRGRPDLVLLDLSFSDGEKDGVAATLRADTSGVTPIRFVVFSDRPDPELELAATRLGAAGFLRKGFGAELVNGVEAFGSGHALTPAT